MRRLPPLLAMLMLAGCAVSPAMNDDDAVARAVEPSLRIAAATAEANNDWKGAAQHWNTLYQRHPNDKILAVSLARSLRNGGQAQQAADFLQADVARLGRDARIIAELGKDYLAAERLGLAMKSLEEARKLAPKDWEVHSALGVTLDALSRYDEAQAAYGKALELSPDNALVLNNLALSQAQAGRLDQALETMKRADEQPASGAQIRQNLALLLALKGDTRTAERLAAKDLPADMARANGDVFRSLAAGKQ